MSHNLKPVINEKGETLSPSLGEGVKNYMIDIDGTITDDVPNEEPERMVTCLPYPDALETLNKWYDEGHIITFFTSRTEEHREITETWLNKFGFKYHGILMGKPSSSCITNINSEINEDAGIYFLKAKGKAEMLGIRKLLPSCGKNSKC